MRDWAKEAVQQEKALKTQKGDRRTLAVLYFHNKTGWTELKLLQKGLAMMLTTDLSKVKEIQLLERARIQALVEELGFGVAGLVSADKAPRVGRLLGADLMVGGDIVKKSENAFQLSSGLMNVPTVKMLGEPAVAGKLLEELFRMEKDLLFEIIRLLKIQLTPELEIELREPVTENLEALLYLFRAIEEADEGDLDEANDLLDKSLTEDPGFDLPAGAKRELAGIYPTDRGGEKEGNGSSAEGDGSRVKKECAATRNKLKKSFFRSRRRF
jgi:TolB-like protein